MGIIQGITEFLPVSSSGHLEIAKIWLGFTEANTFYSILLHAATLVAVFIAFRKRIGAIIVSLARFVTRKTEQDDKVNLKLFLLLCSATAATACVFLGMKFLDESLFHNPKLIGSCFIITGGILIVSRFFNGTTQYPHFGFLRSLAVGLAQGIGILPGISRSGITITGALSMGMSRELAGEFSFLLSIPAILGAIVADLKDATALFEQVSIVSIILGMAAAFVVGLVSILFLMKLIKRGQLFFFSLYLIPAGILTIIFIS